MKLLEAFERIKGYCDKQTKCDNCKFHTEDDECVFRDNIPCNWEMPKRGDDE